MYVYVTFLPASFEIYYKWLQIKALQQSSVSRKLCDLFKALCVKQNRWDLNLNDKRVQIKQNQQTPQKSLSFVFITSNPTKPSQVKSRSTCSPFSVNRINSKLYMRSKLLPNPLKKQPNLQVRRQTAITESTIAPFLVMSTEIIRASAGGMTPTHSDTAAEQKWGRWASLSNAKE